MIIRQNILRRMLLSLLRDQNAYWLGRRFSSTAPPFGTAGNAFANVDIESLNRCQLEFNSGAGGVEAMLFARDLLNMYRGYVARKNWRWQQIQLDEAQAGAVRSAIVAVEGPCSFSALRFEAGVHRVQRFPVTDRTRVHTSTVSVAVLPEPENAEVTLDCKDVKMEAMRASGPGGQNVNKKSSAVRLIHLPSGAQVKVMDERHFHVNLQIAYRRLGSILLQQEIDRLASAYDSSRKLQVGSLARSAKIRTYNFKENRVTDHRIKHSIMNLVDFLRGGESLEEMLGLLQEAYVMQTLEEEQDKYNSQIKQQQ